MKKLEKGDYVVNLSKQQFDEILNICDMCYVNIKDQKFYYDKKDNYIYCHNESEAINELSFDEFKQRAINTFKQC